MTVSSSTNKVSFNGDGSTTVFAYSFKVFDESDLTVILRASDGTETTQTITTNYTVSGVGDAGGGNVTMVTAPASGEQLTILREQPLTQGLDLVPNDPFPANSIEDSLDKLTFMVQQQQEELDRSIKASKTTTISTVEFVESAATRANKVFAFDGSGDLDLTQEIGTFQGDWAASTAYAVRDIVKDTNNNNIYIANTAHTSSGTVPLSSNADIAKWDLLVDAAAATTSANNAATSATAAATSATAAATSATAAATSESNAATSASNASTSETNAAASATNAATSESNAAGSESAAATSESNAATSATNASTSASAAATSATNAATSEAAAAASQAAAATSETNAATSATSAATNATNAATSASNASTAQTAAETAQTAAEAAQAAAELAADNFDDTYLGSKSSDPTVDNDGGALNAGDLYFNTTSNTLKVYSGSAWQDAAVDSSGFVQTTGDTMTGDLDIQGTLTSDGLTVDTNTLHVDSTNNRVGIGTTSPSAVLQVQDATNATIDAVTTGGATTRVSSASTAGYFGTITNHPAIFFTNSTENMRIDSSGNVGIGTSSPAVALTVNGEIKSIVDGSESAPSIQLNDGNTGLFKAASNTIGFTTGGTERMRIDSSGNLLVGKTSIGIGNTGFEFNPSGYMFATRSGGYTANFNRQTSDGDIVVFNKDGSAVGSIGTGLSGGSEFGIKSNTGELQLASSYNSNTVTWDGSQLYPSSTNNLGASSAKWQDLYLSGGVYLGGTGSANKLDDYEEGTWTIVSGSGSNPLSVQGSGNRYTRIGRQVIAYFDIQWNSGNTGTASANISGLPFLPASNHEGDGAVTVGYITGSAGVDFVAHVSNSNSSFNFYANGSSGSNSYAQLAGRRIAGYVQYYTYA